MPKAAVLFDLDGTLVHTRADYRYDVVGRTLADFERSAAACDIDAFWFEASRHRIIRERFDVDPAAFWDRFAEYDVASLRRLYTAPYEDTISALDDLSHRGIPLAIVTGAPAHIAQLEIEMLGAERFAAIVVIADHETLRAKPEADGVLHALRALRAEAADALFVGNAEEDIAAARAAGVTDVHVDRGEHRFTTLTPAHRIASLHELAELIR
jgi:HAD superfamily hydrolase (TIGR01509 family)